MDDFYLGIISDFNPWDLPPENIFNFTFTRKASLTEQTALVGEQIARHRAEHSIALLDRPNIVLSMPCAFLTVLPGDPQLLKVARQLRFAPRLENIAQKIIGRIHERSGPSFNALHLRLEPDSVVWIKPYYGGLEKVQRGYLQTADSMGFNSSVPVYISSGLTATGVFDASLLPNFNPGYANEILFKELFLNEVAEGANLDSTQLAAVDFMVVSEAENLLGFGYSTFSYLAVEKRNLISGYSPSASRMVSDKTDPYLAKHASLVPQ